MQQNVVALLLRGNIFFLGKTRTCRNMSKRSERRTAKEGGGLVACCPHLISRCGSVYHI